MRNLFLILLLTPLMALGQKASRLQPGKMYEAGETLFAPRFGFTATVPVGFSGLLPRESEVFLLSAQTMPAQIYVFGFDKSDLAFIKSKWEKGVDMDADVHLSAKAVSIQNGILQSEVLAKGPYINKSNRGYATARCGPDGACVACLATMPAAEFEAISKIVDDFIGKARFETPSTVTPYADFDWKEFLSGKTLTTYAIAEGGSKETRIDLCADGTFKSKVSKRGIMKNVNPAYKGSPSGTWTAEGVGETGKLILEFKDKDLGALVSPLQIRDEKIYANGERYFAADSDRCK